MKRMKLPFGRALQVYWHDSTSLPGWRYNTKGIAEVGRVVSIGYVVGSSKDAVALSTSLVHDGSAIDPINIPWTSIKAIAPIGERWDLVQPPYITD